MKTQNNMPNGEFQKILALGLQNLSIQATLLENQIAVLNQEMRTLERDDEIEKLDTELYNVRALYTRYNEYVDPDMSIELEDFFNDENN
ncbi:MAG: hypothetical protein FWF14_02065 [Streptococcaceae bacterium]|nr:hypothetical protein [Streptococcaceae bacterium]